MIRALADLGESIIQKLEGLSPLARVLFFTAVSTILVAIVSHHNRRCEDRAVTWFDSQCPHDDHQLEVVDGVAICRCQVSQ